MTPTKIFNDTSQVTLRLTDVATLDATYYATLATRDATYHATSRTTDIFQ